MPVINRVPAFTDTFDSSISASYDNGPGDWDTLSWATGGYVEVTTLGTSGCIVRNTGNYSPDQWATVTVENINATGAAQSVSAVVRAAGGASEAMYFATLSGYSLDSKYGIWEVDAAFGFTSLAQDGTGAAVTGPVELSLEMVGTALAAYSDEGGSDAQVLTASDATIPTGRPGALAEAFASAANARFTALKGGSYFQEFGDFLVAVGAYTSGTGSITPQIPTVLTDAADVYPVLLAHSAGGENITLGTANGFAELTNSPSATGAGTAGVKVAAFGNTSGAGGSDPVITDPGNHCGGLILLTKHPDGLPTVDITAANQKASASTSFSISGADTTVADCLCIPISGRDNDSAAAAYSGWTNASLASITEIFDAGTASGNGGGLGIAAGIKTTAGTVSATTGTVTSSVNANFFLALAPPSTGVTGTGAITLDAMAVAGAGAVERKGTGAITLDAMTVSGAGAVERKGTGAILLPEMTVAGSGTRIITGTGAILLPEVTVDGTGTVSNEITGSGAIDLPEMQVDGAGAVERKGTGAILLPEVTVDGAGVRQANGTGDIPLPEMTVAGAGAVERKGSGAIDLPELVVDGAGNVFSGIGGSGAITFDPLEVDGAGTVERKGTGAVLLPELQVAGEGTVETPATGSGALLLPELEVSGAGIRGVVGSGAITLPEMRVSGYDFPPVTDIYDYLAGTAVDRYGRMVTSFIEPDELLVVPHFIEGFAHDESGRRLVTTWPSDVGYLAGLAVRADGVQVIAPDTAPDRAVCGIPLTYRGETCVSENYPAQFIEGFGLDSQGLLTVTDAGP